MNHHEINSDEAIDRLLTSLRTASPPEGMKGRILRTLEDRTIVPRGWTFAAPGTWAVATASIAVVALAFSFAAHRRHHTTPQIAALPRPLVPANEPLPRNHLSLFKPIRPTAHRVHQRYVVEEATAVPEAVSAGDALALSEARAPSHPAPPMPLTDQEKLLLGLIRKGDPIELAMLDPQLRSSEESNSRADFDRFFPPQPLPIIAPPAPNTKPNTGENK